MLELPMVESARMWTYPQ